MAKKRKNSVVIDSSPVGPNWQTAHVNSLVKAQIHERHPVACGDCGWAGDVVFHPVQDAPKQASWICPKCQVPHVVKVGS